MELLFVMVMLLLFARIGGEMAERLNQSTLVGEIAAGIILGPSILGILGTNMELNQFIEIGGILLLFLIGLNTKMEEVHDNIVDALFIGVVGQVVAFVIIVLSAHFLLGFNYAISAFLGAVFSQSSTGVCVKCMIDLNKLYTKAGKFLLSLSIVDDFVGIIVFAIAATYFTNSALNTSEIWKLILTVVGFITIMTTVGAKIVPQVLKVAEKMVVKEALISFTLVIGFAIALLAHQIGISLIIGAFIGGMVINKSPFVNPAIVPKLSTIAYGLFIPMFFTNIGVSTSISDVSSNMVLFISMFFIVLISKFLPLFMASRYMGYKKGDAFALAAGMIPRAEFSLILAASGFGMKLIDFSLFSTIVAVSIATILIAPSLIKRGFTSDSSY
ncbi:MAG: cation:proton antiporter [Nanoarchaeota archaeon]|nr:cation:proton antiporter [Nanoarchaeota archaeon]MBU4299893.1 cation:proton antiporter [Nanoarchaeota archaeon]MBU4452328.1 cation:proton antiporter [Nanoarchaeota archaeon]MCG2724548.1 cation:proton antiporter [archaeon]